MPAKFSNGCRQFGSSDHYVALCPEVQCHLCQGMGHMMSMCPEKGESKCFRCKGKDHWIKDCPLNELNLKRPRDGSDEDEAEKPVPVSQLKALVGQAARARSEPVHCPLWKEKCTQCPENAEEKQYLLEYVAFLRRF